MRRVLQDDRLIFYDHAESTVKRPVNPVL